MEDAVKRIVLKAAQVWKEKESVQALECLLIKHFLVSKL